MPADGQWNLAQWNFGELWRIGNKGIKQRVLCGGTLGVFEPGAKERHAVKDGPGISAPDTISRDHKPEEDRRRLNSTSLGSISLGPISPMLMLFPLASPARFSRSIRKPG